MLRVQPNVCNARGRQEPHNLFGPRQRRSRPCPGHGHGTAAAARLRAGAASSGCHWQCLAFPPAANIITRVCLGTCFLDCMSQYHTISRWFAGESLQRQHFDGGKTDKAVPVGEGSKLYYELNVWAMALGRGKEQTVTVQAELAARCARCGKKRTLSTALSPSLLSLALATGGNARRSHTYAHTCRQAKPASTFPGVNSRRPRSPPPSGPLGRHACGTERRSTPDPPRPAPALAPRSPRFCHPRPRPHVHRPPTFRFPAPLGPARQAGMRQAGVAERRRPPTPSPALPTFQLPAPLSAPSAPLGRPACPPPHPRRSPQAHVPAAAEPHHPRPGSAFPALPTFTLSLPHSAGRRAASRSGGLGRPASTSPARAAPLGWPACCKLERRTRPACVNIPRPPRPCSAGRRAATLCYTVAIRLRSWNCANHGPGWARSSQILKRALASQWGPQEQIRQLSVHVCLDSQAHQFKTLFS